MIHRFSVLCCLVLAIGIAGCSHLDELISSPEERLGNWVSNHEYGKALDWINSVPETDLRYPALQTKRKAIAKLASAYEKSVLKKVDQNLKKKSIGNAVEVLEDALDNYPESKILQSKRDSILSRQTRSLMQNEAKTSISKAKWLLDESNLLEERLRIEPDDSVFRRDLNDVRSDINDAITDLQECARTMIQIRSLKFASDCLKQAKLMSPSSEHKTVIKLLEKKLKKEKNKLWKERGLARQKDKKLQKKSRHLRNRITEDLKAGKYLEARTFMTKLRRLDPTNPTVKKLYKDYLAALNEGVKKKIKKGGSLYREGKIKEAKSTWEYALKLDPKNKKIKDQISRADRVLKKLGTLRKTSK